MLTGAIAVLHYLIRRLMIDIMLIVAIIVTQSLYNKMNVDLPISSYTRKTYIPHNDVLASQVSTST